ncbi:Kelch-like protein 12 [Sparganum proliferum]
MDQVLEFKGHLNGVFLDIQFKTEEEENNQMDFLDVLVCRKDGGGLRTKSLGVEPLAAACMELIKDNFQSFILSEHFIHLPEANLLSLLREDDLQVAEEDKIVEAITKWISVKKTVSWRCDLLPRIMEQIDWRRTTPQTRKRLFESDEVAAHEESRKRLYLVEQWITRPLTRGLSECPFRKCSRGRKRLLLIGPSRGGSEWIVQPYDPNSKSDVPLIRVKERFSAAYANVDVKMGCTYALFSSVYRWRHLPDMSCRRESPAAVGVPNCRLFVLGGYDGRSFLSSVVFCSLSAKWETTGMATGGDFWKTVAPMSVERSCLAATYFRGQIVAAGGWNGRDYLSLVEVFSLPDAYQIPEGQWTRIAPMQQGRRSFHLLACADGIFALGKQILSFLPYQSSG